MYLGALIEERIVQEAQPAQAERPEIRNGSQIIRPKTPARDAIPEKREKYIRKYFLESDSDNVISLLTKEPGRYKFYRIESDINSCRLHPVRLVPTEQVQTVMTIES